MNYYIPTVIDATGKGERPYDIYSRLLKETDQLRIDSDRNNWMSAEEALNYGLIDKIINHRE